MCRQWRRDPGPGAGGGPLAECCGLLAGGGGNRKPSSGIAALVTAGRVGPSVSALSLPTVHGSQVKMKGGEEVEKRKFYKEYFLIGCKMLMLRMTFSFLQMKLVERLLDWGR